VPRGDVLVGQAGREAQGAAVTRCAHPLHRRLDGGSGYVVPTSFCLDCGASIQARPQLALTLTAAPAPAPSSPSSRPVVIAYGGGLDSFAMLLGALARGIRPAAVCFADTGHPDDPSEWPGTYRHLDEVVRPLCAREGIELAVLTHEHYPIRAGRKDEARSLFAWFAAKRAIPVAAPGRACTSVAKVERFERWLDDRFPGQTVEVWLGFEAGEESRAAKDPNAGKARKPAPGRAVRANRYPLIEWGLCRCRCEQLVREAGHPVPRKSACVFCPYASKGDWQALARELPETFARVVELERDRPITKVHPDKKTGRPRGGNRLSIMGYRSGGDGVGLGRPQMLPDFVSRPYKGGQAPCKVCGAEVRASKATACGYLEEGTAS
jgi:hypothetical protein